MKRFPGILITILLIFSSYASSLSAADLQRRFSIAISGGASKGAYEAGLNWGLIKIMRDIGNVEHSLVGVARNLEAASFSGASAGGINTLLSSLAWCSLPQEQGGIVNTIDTNIFRDVWLVPDVNRLLPPKPDSHFYSDNDALLARHDLMQAAGNLRKRWNKPGFRQGCRIPLGVTVTRVKPDEFKIGDIEVQNQRLAIPFVAHTRDDGSLGFEFNPEEFPAWQDPSTILLPYDKNAPPYSIDDQRIEDAVVTSAAYPGGFGRMRMQYCRLDSYAENNAESDATGETQDQSTEAITCPDGYKLAEAEFADGGLFDNLPLGLARKLAEQHEHANDSVLPVTYVYLDPNRERYKAPPAADKRACASDNPPDACRTMEFSLFTEHHLLLGALGTARKYELYRELTSEFWLLSLPQLGYELADKMEAADKPADCTRSIDFFDTRLSCAESIRRAAALLELAYTRNTIAITPPYSASKLQNAGAAYSCDYSDKNPDIDSDASCRVNVVDYRKRLARILLTIAENNDQVSVDMVQRLQESALSMHNDRILRVTDRGAPITGTLLSSFGAFLDLKFREYDYYVGVYDAVIASTETLCRLKFSDDQHQELIQCQDTLAELIYHNIGINNDPRGKYVFARLAQWEFGKDKALGFAYNPMPAEDRDMRIIFKGLVKTLEAGRKTASANQGIFFTENTFFQHLKNEDFEPTPTKDGAAPLLEQIIDDPTHWTSELTRRATTRFVYLEEQADKIYKAREPDPALRKNGHTTIMGISAFTLQTATYNYPDFAFSPSTAPEDWIWRNIIPYEVSFDLIDSDITFTWQPTWSLTDNDLLSIRAGLALTRSVSESDGVNFARENYGSLGLSYSRSTDLLGVSSWGLTAAWYHKWNEPAAGKQDTPGGDVHVSFLNDRLRLSLGVRDFNDASDTWFFSVGITDLPGWIYWLSR